MDLGSLQPIRKVDIGILKQALNTDNITTDEGKTETAETQLLPEIFRLLASLEDESQNMLLSSWAKLEMPLGEETVQNLLSYLAQNPADSEGEKLSVIKAFAFLEKSTLPYSDKIINALKTIFSHQNNLSSLLNNIVNRPSLLNSENTKNLLSQLDSQKLLSVFENVNTEISGQNSIQNGNTFSEKNYNSDQIESLLKNMENTNPKLADSISRLETETKNIVLSSWDKISSDFKSRTVNFLSDFLNNNNFSSNEKLLTIKSLLFMKKNNIPLTENLTKIIMDKFSQHKTYFLAENTDIKDEILSTSNENLKNPISKNDLSIKLNNTPAQIAEQLELISEKKGEIFSLLNRIAEHGEEKTAAEIILGEKIINLEKNQELNPALLALEIPVQIADNKNLKPFYLKIEDSNRNKTEMDSKSAFKITFIIELKNLGFIQSNISIEGSTISGEFFAESETAAEIIDANIELLKTSLNKINYHLESLSIDVLEDADKNIDGNKFYNELVLNELNNIQFEANKYTHIDVKI
ncbi:MULTISPECIES: flagellar hook-length control protein FliK [unclassified Halanaerobium]|uniref:flagellar hook-length control protein FliK n=1 Tax=unclassified Halanaerobium TaxID=2641197 RepID=UPI000DF43421|nr:MULTISPECIES: flagellar hook-length control protein FliK [unclassified Halanaerobium]RCW47782.1 flagellar hook-length control protein FliK [Halanaerobium sp. MA284_MarDTE_T2]RCW81814.1 flagellar hook-length control protein FliK [Halanaerobium sp. DL-01]